MILMKTLILTILGTVTIAHAGEVHDRILRGESESARDLIVSEPALLQSLGEDGASPLHLACMMADAELARWLIARGASVDSLDVRSRNPYFYAVHYRGDDEDALLTILDILKETACDVGAKDINGSTPLFWIGRFPRAVAWFLEAGVDGATVSNSGMTALHATVFNAPLEVVEILIDAGCRPNAVDTSGNTPLHSAAMSGRSGLVDLLLVRGGDPSLKNDQGWTPGRIARESGHIELANQLDRIAGAP